MDKMLLRELEIDIWEVRDPSIFKVVPDSFLQQIEEKGSTIEVLAERKGKEGTSLLLFLITDDDLESMSWITNFIRAMFQNNDCLIAKAVDPNAKNIYLDEIYQKYSTPILLKSEKCNIVKLDGATAAQGFIDINCQKVLIDPEYKKQVMLNVFRLSNYATGGQRSSEANGGRKGSL